MKDFEQLSHAFEAIYREDRWSNGSGPGSRPDNTMEYRSFLERFIKENKIKTVTDLGCGDWQFSKLIDWSSVNYHGVDVVDSIVQNNNFSYACDNIRFSRFMGIENVRTGDLLLSKEVLQHLPNDIIRDYLDWIRQNYKFALLTNAIEPSEAANLDISPGDFRPLRLDEAPFFATGAIVSTYFPQSGSHFWKNGIFLLFGEEKTTE